MRASNTYNGGGSKATKIAIVTALHIGIALAFINMKVVGPSAPPVEVKPITRQTPETPPQPTPVDMDTTTEKFEPTIFVPDTVFETALPVVDAPVVTTKLPAGPAPDVPGGHGVEGGAGGGTLPPAKPVHIGPRADARDCVRPDYPAKAARNGDTGTVGLALLIGVDGKVSDSKVERSSGFKELDRAAVAALSMCKFKPATTDGVPEPAWSKMAYVWSLD
jgi:periplasmic protein TonB